MHLAHETSRQACYHVEMFILADFRIGLDIVAEYEVFVLLDRGWWVSDPDRSNDPGKPLHGFRIVPTSGFIQPMQSLRMHQDLSSTRGGDRSDRAEALIVYSGESIHEIRRASICMEGVELEHIVPFGFSGGVVDVAA